MRVTKSSTLLAAVAAIGLSLSAGALAAPMPVYANNGAPGDAFTVPGTVNGAQLVGTSGWVYNNVRNGGSVGINTSNPFLGNASAVMSGNVGPGGDSSKADIEYYAALGTFSAFQGMSYDWYRSSSSTNNTSQHPSLRILLDVNGNAPGGFGSLVFEAVYNGSLTATTDTWVHETIGLNTNLWNTGLNLGFGYDLDGINGYAYDSTLADWQASPLLANAVIVGFSSGFGSGWGPFSGAVDNISWTIGNQTTTTNFEVLGANAVPEPGTLALLGLTLAGMAVLRRRKN